MKVLIVEPGREPCPKEIENTLAAMQEAVGGYIEAVYMNEDVIIVNENGKILGLPPNRSFGNDIFAGTFFIASADGDEFASLSDEKLAYYSDIFKDPLLESCDEIQDDESWEYEL